MSNPLIPLNPNVPSANTGIVSAQSVRDAALSTAIAAAEAARQQPAPALRDLPIVQRTTEAQ